MFTAQFFLPSVTGAGLSSEDGSAEWAAVPAKLRGGKSSYSSHVGYVWVHDGTCE